MVKYSCELCGKEFSQNLTMILIINANALWNNADKIKGLLDKAVGENQKN